MMWNRGGIGVRRTGIGGEVAVVISEVMLWNGVVCQNARERAEGHDDDRFEHLVGS